MCFWRNSISGMTKKAYLRRLWKGVGVAVAELRMLALTSAPAALRLLMRLRGLCPAVARMGGRMEGNFRRQNSWIRRKLTRQSRSEACGNPLLSQRQSVVESSMLEIKLLFTFTWVLSLSYRWVTVKVPERVRFRHENVHLSANHSSS